MSTSRESIDEELPAGQSSAEREPNILHFGLRQWFYFVSSAVIFCALMVRLEGAWRLVLASIVALIAAHVLGTVLGTRLRDTSAEVVRWKARPKSKDADAPVATAQPVVLNDLQLPESTTLAVQKGRPRRSNWALAIGGLLGSFVGAAAINAFVGSEVTWPGLALGSASCGVIGAWMALLASNFWAIAREAWRHASHQD